MAYDEHGAGQMSGATIRRASSIHLREEADGAALLVDDRTLTAAHINKSACILFQALDRPRTLGDLADILAGTVKCSASEAFLPVVKLVEQAVGLGWLEVQGDSLSNGRPESER
jgi:hypothetical protein